AHAQESESTHSWRSTIFLPNSSDVVRDACDGSGDHGSGVVPSGFAFRIEHFIHCIKQPRRYLKDAMRQLGSVWFRGTSHDPCGNQLAQYPAELLSIDSRGKRGTVDIARHRV